MASSRTIGALSREAGVGIETIRYYERIGLLPPPRRAESGYRHYNDDDIGWLRFVKRGRELGFSIDEIRTLLQLAAQPEQPCAEADRLVREHLAEVEQRIADLSRLHAELAGLACCSERRASDCRIIEALAGAPLPHA